MSFRPIPFVDLMRRVFYEYQRYGKILGLSEEKFFQGFPETNLAVTYMGKQAATPFGPAAGPHTQLAQNIVLAWLTGSRIFELKTVQVLDQLEISRPCIDTENIGFNVEWSQELRLEESLREYVKAWMLIEMINASGLPGEDFSKHYGDTVFDLSIGYDFKGIRSEKMHSYIQGLRNARSVIDVLRDEIPQEFSQFKELEYTPQVIDSITLSTFHGCPADQIEHIVSHLLTQHHVNVIVKLNPTLLGQQEVAYILHDVLGYKDLVLQPEAFEQDIQFDRAIDLIRSMLRTASSCGKSLGLKFTNTLVVKNHKGYFSDDMMYLSGPPLHVLALRLLQKVRDALGTLHVDIPTSFSAGIDEKNFADLISLNLVPVTVCTDLLKPPGYEKCPTYLKSLGETMQSVGAMSISEYILKRFDHQDESAERNLETLLKQTMNDPRYTCEKNSKAPKKLPTELQLYDCTSCGRCIAVCPNNANFEYHVEPAEIPYVKYQLTDEGVVEIEGGVFSLKKFYQVANFADCCNECSLCAIHCVETGKPYKVKPKYFGNKDDWTVQTDCDGFYVEKINGIEAIVGRIGGKEYSLQFDPQANQVIFEDDVIQGIFDYPSYSLIKTTVLDSKKIGHILDMRAYHIVLTQLKGVLNKELCNYVNVRYLNENE